MAKKKAAKKAAKKKVKKSTPRPRKKRGVTVVSISDHAAGIRKAAADQAISKEAADIRKAAAEEQQSAVRPPLN